MIITKNYKYNRRIFWCKVCGKITSTTNDEIYRIKLCKEHQKVEFNNGFHIVKIEEQKRKVSEFFKEYWKTHIHPAIGNKYSLNRLTSIEEREKISKTLKEQYKNGRIVWNKNKKLSIETRRKTI